MRLKKFNSCIKYLFKTSLSSVYTYAYIIVLPVLFEVFMYIYFIQPYISADRAIVIGPILFFSMIIPMLFVTNIIVTYRETIFLKQLKNFGVSNLMFLGTLLLIFLVYAFVALIVSSILLVILDAATKSNKVIECITTMISQPSFLVIIINLLLNATVIYLLGVILSGFISNIYLVQGLSLIILAFLFASGDYFIDYEFSQNQYYQGISYLSIQKYFNWIYYMAYTKSFDGGKRVYLIAYNIGSIIPFKNVYAPLFSMICIAPFQGYISYASFNLSFKK
ncbi:hypothetical protein SHELI_v1c10320 [Spiroplasma helicoides]|uniref:Uncharacterized protein n=2 Tax=Spiroplasma helicoides TaxID=216938 RepID=A0A1B3SM15_9MOLU|nr:hypothetical protein SHELI_v1c10320 [Spiroplasma helicoides]